MTEIFSVASLLLQAFVVILSMILYGYIPDKHAWRWFLFASIVVFIRRVTGAYGTLLDSDVDLVQDIETMGISVMWIIYVLKRSGRLSGG